MTKMTQNYRKKHHIEKCKPFFGKCASEMHTLGNEEKRIEASGEDR